jgi:hypothetical protein
MWVLLFKEFEVCKYSYFVDINTVRSVPSAKLSVIKLSTLFSVVIFVVLVTFSYLLANLLSVTDFVIRMLYKDIN